MSVSSSVVSFPFPSLLADDADGEEDDQKNNHRAAKDRRAIVLEPAGLACVL